MKYPLEGVKVVDLAAYIAGAYCASLLADMGAGVVKVESPAGDSFRAMGGAFQAWNRGKRAIVLNLTKQEARDILYRMVADADVVTENYRPGVAEKLGADYETIKRINPNIIYCSVTGYGLSGPYINNPAFDPIMQALSGAMAAQGGEGNPPVYLRVPFSDYGAAMLAAYGIAAALFHRAQTGRGQRLDTCLLDASVAGQAGEFFTYSAKRPPPRADGLGLTSTYRLYEAKDGWFFLSCSDDESWTKTCEALGREDLGEKFHDERTRLDHGAEIGAALESLFATEARDHWLSRLQAAGVKCAASRHMRDVHETPQAEHLGLTVEALSPDAGPIRQMGVPIRLSRTPGKVWGPSPAHGQHTDEVLSELGLSSLEIADLRDRGALG